MIRICLVLALAICSVIAQETYSGSIIKECPYNKPGSELDPNIFVRTWWFQYGTPNPYEPKTDCPNEVITYNSNTKQWKSVKSAYNRDSKTYYHVLTEDFNDVNGGWIRLYDNTAYTQAVDNTRNYENIIIPFMNLQYAVEFYCANNGQFNGTGGELIMTKQNPTQAEIQEGLDKFASLGADITKLTPYNQQNCPPFNPSELSYF